MSGIIKVCPVVVEKVERRLTGYICHTASMAKSIHWAKAELEQSYACSVFSCLISLKNKSIKQSVENPYDFIHTYITSNSYMLFNVGS